MKSLLALCLLSGSPVSAFTRVMDVLDRAQTRAVHLRSPPRSAFMRADDEACPINYEDTTTVKDFLTQRAIQTSTYYYNEFGNGHLKEWVESFKDHHGRFTGTMGDDVHHGCFALAVPWKEFLGEMAMTPPETHEVKVPRAQTSGSAGNPYIKQQYTVYTVDIKPLDVVDGILKAREEIAEEFRDDLELMALENKEVWTHHEEEVKNGSDEEEGHRMPAYDAGRSKASSTPLRRQSYDLLQKLTTFVAACTLIKNMQRDSAQADSAKWLFDFTQGYMEEFINQPARPYGVAKRYLQDMMNAPISMKTGRSGQPVFVDPVAIAQELLDERLRVAEGWREELETVDDDHIYIRRIMLEQINHQANIAALEKSLMQDLVPVRKIEKTPEKEMEMEMELPQEDAVANQATDTVSSWYDAGVRLTLRVSKKPAKPAEPEQAEPVKKVVTSWYDSGVRLIPKPARGDSYLDCLSACVKKVVTSWYDSGVRLQVPAAAPGNDYLSSLDSRSSKKAVVEHAVLTSDPDDWRGRWREGQVAALEKVRAEAAAMDEAASTVSSWFDRGVRLAQE